MVVAEALFQDRRRIGFAPRPVVAFVAIITALTSMTAVSEHMHCNDVDCELQPYPVLRKALHELRLLNQSD